MYTYDIYMWRMKGVSERGSNLTQMHTLVLQIIIIKILNTLEYIYLKFCLLLESAYPSILLKGKILFNFFCICAKPKREYSLIFSRRRAAFGLFILNQILEDDNDDYYYYRIGAIGRRHIAFCMLQRSIDNERGRPERRRAANLPLHGA